MAVDANVLNALNLVLDTLAPTDGSAGLLDRIQLYSTNPDPSNEDVTNLIFDIVKIVVGSIRTAIS